MLGALLSGTSADGPSNQQVEKRLLSLEQAQLFPRSVAVVIGKWTPGAFTPGIPWELQQRPLIFLALLDRVSRANAVARASVVRRRRPSVKRVFSETIKRINANVCGKVAVHPISRPFFSVLKILNFLILTNFFHFRWHGTLWEWKCQNATPPTVTILSQPNFFYLFPVTVLTKLVSRNFEILNLFLKKKKDWNFP